MEQVASRVEAARVPSDAPEVAASAEQAGDSPAAAEVPDVPGAWQRSVGAVREEVSVYAGRLELDTSGGFWPAVRQLLSELAADAGLDRRSAMASAQKVLRASGHPWAERVASAMPVLLLFGSSKR